MAEGVELVNRGPENRRIGLHKGDGGTAVPFLFLRLRFGCFAEVAAFARLYNYLTGSCRHSAGLVEQKLYGFVRRIDMGWLKLS
jgi:hypothetical protein